MLDLLVPRKIWYDKVIAVELSGISTPLERTGRAVLKMCVCVWMFVDVCMSKCVRGGYELGQIQDQVFCPESFETRSGFVRSRW